MSPLMCAARSTGKSNSLSARQGALTRPQARLSCCGIAAAAENSITTTLLADPPSDLSAQALACWIEIAKAQRSTGSSLRKRGAARAGECYANGAITLESALLASAFLGDLDATYSLADTQPTTPISAVLFDPRLPALRADPRFGPLMERYGLLAYWRESGNQPDSCKNEKAPVCASISSTTKPSSK